MSEPDIPIVINEILADNGTTGHDPQNQYEDWIELYNWGGGPVDVGGMYLTDDLTVPTKWQIPTDVPAATTIAAGGHLLIWADGDIADAGLHAGFRLSADGEQVGLFAADGTTLIDGFSFDKQSLDISYGRRPDGGPDLQLLFPPTPGAANVTSYQGVAEEPQANPESRLCTTPITVTLTTPTEGASIYYTLDGSNPFSSARGRATGSLYTGPIPIGRTVTLKAIAWRSGWRVSPIHTQRYVFVGSDIRDFSSPLPIAIVDTMGRGVSRQQVPAYGYFFNTDEQGRAVMAEEIDFAGKAAINIRGKSSEGFSKHQYHLETWDEHDKDKAVSILGFPAESDWVLQGPYSDKSLMRNVLAYQWSNEIGRYAPRTRFIELFLNANDDTVSMNDYAGVYVFMEKIKLDPDRVDVGGPPADSAITGGYIIKKDKYDGDDQRFSTSRGQTLIYYDPNGFELSQQERDWIRNFMNSFEAALYGYNFMDPVSGYAKFIDVNSFIDHHIVVETAKNIDGFRLSTYMHIDHAGILHMGPVWDYNLSLGNANYLEGWIPTGWYYRQLGDGDYPYWRRLFQDSEFRLRYADRWFELRRDLFTTDRMMQRIEEHAALIEEPQARNFQRWTILGVYIWPNWYIAKTWREEIDWMKGWLADRVEWMDSQIAAELAPAPPALSHQGGHVVAGLDLAMSSSSGTIHYTLDGSDPRSLGTSGATRYISPVPITQTTRVRVRALNGSRWSALNEAVFAIGPIAQSLRISEIMFHPAQTGAPDDPNTEFIELTNIGSQSINLNLVKFTNGVEFTFPSYELPPGGYCIVVRNAAAFEARYGPGLPVAGQYAGSLNNAGERIELLDPVGTVIHDFRYQDNWFDITDGPGFSLTVKDPHTADPNAYGDKSLWRPSAAAGGSPGADDSGQVPALGAVVINELLANSQGSGPDWIELHNTTDQPIGIGGWFLSDDASNLTKYEIAAGTSIAANGYIVFYENRHFGNRSDPGSHEPFGLSANGETVYLHSGSEGVLTGYSEQEKFDASEAGVSLGRYRKSTGTYNFIALSKATPGAANASPQVGPVVIHEIMYHPDALGDAEYVELLNISSEPATLYDADSQVPWRFSDSAGIEFLFPADPPVTLAAGEYLLLVKDTGLFSTKYAPPAGVQILPWTLGNLADRGEKLQLSKPGDTDADGAPVWIRVDRVVYSDGSHPGDFAGDTDPWPTQADGQGASLSRTAASAYGNDPANWHAATPSPGQAIAHTPRTPPGSR